MTKFTKAVVHHAEDMFAWRDPNADNQMHWVADVKPRGTDEFIDTVLTDIWENMIRKIPNKNTLILKDLKLKL